MVNPANTVYVIVIRYVYLIVSLITGIIFWWRYRLLPDEDKTIEQNFVAGISLMLLLFNDPLYAATVLAPNGFTYLIPNIEHSLR